MIYQQCGTFCPPTCEDIDAPATCQGGCAEGCFCPDNQVLLDGACVDPFVCTGQSTTYVYMYACMHACMYVCMYVCMYACMYI